ASAVTAAVKPRIPQPPASIGAPEVTGQSVVGGVLSCTTGAWGGDMPQTYTYQWLLDGAPLTGATTATYIVQPADDGHRIVCRVTATNAVAAVNASSTPVGIGTAPSNLAKPTITGLAQQQQTLTCEAGGWGGSQPQTYSYTWLRNALPVGEAQTYLV